MRVTDCKFSRGYNLAIEMTQTEITELELPVVRILEIVAHDKNIFRLDIWVPSAVLSQC
jgi:hypothetical protein